MNVLEGQLHLPGGVGAPGFLSIPDLIPEPILLSARHTRVIVELAQARARQSHWPAESQGWMKAAAIAEAMGQGPTDYAVMDDTIRKYIGRIERAIERRLPGVSPPFELFDRKPVLGYRLRFSIQLFLPEVSKSGGVHAHETASCEVARP